MYYCELKILKHCYIVFQAANDVLLRKARGILNKLCPQKFDILVEKFNELEIDSDEKLRLCMELVFEKVTNSFY